MNEHPLAKLCDAAVYFVLMITLLAGADVKWIVLFVLMMGLVTSLCRAFCALIDPLIRAVKR